MYSLNKTLGTSLYEIDQGYFCRINNCIYKFSFILTKVEIIYINNVERK